MITSKNKFFDSAQKSVISDKKTNLTIGICLVITILFSNLVLGFGVSSSCWKGNPLIAYPGKTATLSLALQNMVGTDDVEVMAEIIQGEGIASLDKEDYIVKSGTKDTVVPVKIKIPSNVSINTTYNVIVSIKTVTSGAGGGVVLGTGMDSSCEVLVLAPPPEEKAKIGKLTIIITAAILILIVIIITVLIRRRNK